MEPALGGESASSGVSSSSLSVGNGDEKSSRVNQSSTVSAEWSKETHKSAYRTVEANISAHLLLMITIMVGVYLA